MPDLTIYYQTSAGTKYILQGDNKSFVDVLPLYGFSWSYQTSNRVGGNGGFASGFSRQPRTVSLEVRTRGFSRQEFLDKMNALIAAADADAIAETPGRLYAGEQYLTCFLAVSGRVSAAPPTGNFAVQEISVLAVEPYWCTDKTTYYNISSSGGTTDSMSKRYNLRNPYHYSGTDIANASINNTHYAPAPAVITFYGPCANPVIQINGVTYQVNGTVLASERMEIDQVKRTIHRISANGARTNEFNSRIKTSDVFTPVPPGESPVIYSGDYAISVTLVEQRSQLKWTV